MDIAENDQNLKKSSEWRKKQLFGNEKRTSNTSGITGVHKYRNNWGAQIHVKGKIYWLGGYKNIDDAAKIQKEAEEHLKTGDFIEWFEQNHPFGDKMEKR